MFPENTISDGLMTSSVQLPCQIELTPPPPLPLIKRRTYITCTHHVLKSSMKMKKSDLINQHDEEYTCQIKSYGSQNDHMRLCPTLSLGCTK